MLLGIKSPGSGRNLVPLFPQKLNLPLFRGKLFYFLGNKQKKSPKILVETRFLI